jgi:hypothetical protein
MKFFCSFFVLTLYCGFLFGQNLSIGGFGGGSVSMLKIKSDTTSRFQDKGRLGAGFQLGSHFEYRLSYFGVRFKLQAALFNYRQKIHGLKFPSDFPDGETNWLSSYRLYQISPVFDLMFSIPCQRHMFSAYVGAQSNFNFRLVRKSWLNYSSVPPDEGKIVESNFRRVSLVPTMSFAYQYQVSEKKWLGVELGYQYLRQTPLKLNYTNRTGVIHSMPFNLFFSKTINP